MAQYFSKPLFTMQNREMPSSNCSTEPICETTQIVHKNLKKNSCINNFLLVGQMWGCVGFMEFFRMVKPPRKWPRCNFSLHPHAGKKFFSYVITSFLASPGLTGLGNLDHGQKKKVLTSETTLLKYTYDMENLRRQSLRIKDRIPRHWSINHWQSLIERVHLADW